MLLRTVIARIIKIIAQVRIEASSILISDHIFKHSSNRNADLYRELSV